MQMNVYAFIVFLCFVSQTLAFKCYTCDDCTNEFQKPTTCLPNQNRCLKLTAGDYVYKQCAVSHVCKLEGFQDNLENTWKKVNNYLNKREQDDYMGEIKKVFDCCDTEYCNGAGYASIHMYLAPILLISLYLM